MIGDDKTETIVTSNYEGAYETAEDHLERAIKATSISRSLNQPLFAVLQVLRHSSTIEPVFGM